MISDIIFAICSFSTQITAEISNFFVIPLNMLCEASLQDNSANGADLILGNFLCLFSMCSSISFAVCPLKDKDSILLCGIGEYAC